MRRKKGTTNRNGVTLVDRPKISCLGSRSWKKRRASEIEAPVLIFFHGSDLFEKFEGFVELSEALLSGKRTTRETDQDYNRTKKEGGSCRNRKMLLRNLK